MSSVTIRLYESHHDLTSGSETTKTLDDLVAMNAETVAKGKSELPMMGGVLLDRKKSGGVTLKTPVSFTALTGDHDSGTMSIVAAAELLRRAQIAGAVIETTSSTAELPRWRVVVPVSRPMDAATYGAHMSRLNTILEGCLAPESWVGAQSYYYGHLAGGREPEGLAVQGEYIDKDMSIKGTPCLVAPSRTGGSGSGADRLQSYVQDFDYMGEVPHSQSFSQESIARNSIETGECLHQGILAATYLVANGGWPEQFTLDAFKTVARLTRGKERADSIPREWNKALRGVEKWKKEEKAGTTTGGILVPFRLAATLVAIPTSVRGYLPADAIGIVWGAPSSFKSFWSLDIAMSIATGTEWHGRQVRRGVVWYLAGEGQSGTERRVRAWMQERGVEQAAVDGYLFYTPKSLLINEASGEASSHVQALLEEIRSGNIPTHIFVDTIARTMSGDENTSKDMGAYIRALEILVDAVRECGRVVCVTLVHHSRKEGDAYRGSSALRGAADFEFEVGRDGMNMLVECRKMKDFAEPMPMQFKAAEVLLGETVDDWGITERVHSLVLRINDQSAQDKAMEEFEPIMRAIKEGHGTSRTALKTALGIKGNLSMDRLLQPFIDDGWIMIGSAGAGMAKTYELGTKIPVPM